jgi:hypothetical protein
MVATERSGRVTTQYLGTIVNGVEENVIIGAYRFQDDDELVALDPVASKTVHLVLFSFARIPRNGLAMLLGSPT